LLSYGITDRFVTGNFDPEAVLVATDDRFGSWFAGTEMEMKFILGNTTGNRFQFYAPHCQYDKLDDGDRENYSIDSATFKLNATNEDMNNEFCFFQY
jgi:hypothetical protein